MIVIHGVPLSVHVRKVACVCRLKGLAFRIERVLPFHPPAGWSEISPTGLIPVMEDEGFRLSDSTAICAYLERKQPEPHAFPTDAEGLGRAMWFDAYAGGTLFRDLVRPLFYQKIARPNFLGEATDEAEIERLRRDVEPKLFGYLETQAGDGFLAGEALSIADLAVASNLLNHSYIGFGVDAQRWPRLAAWFGKMLRQPVIAEGLAAERAFAESAGLALVEPAALEAA
jgi:glutathione S-transferase